MKQTDRYETPRSEIVVMSSVEVLCASTDKIELNGGFTLETPDMENTGSYGWN